MTLLGGRWVGWCGVVGYFSEIYRDDCDLSIYLHLHGVCFCLKHSRAFPFWLSALVCGVALGRVRGVPAAVCRSALG